MLKVQLWLAFFFGLLVVVVLIATIFYRSGGISGLLALLAVIMACGVTLVFGSETFVVVYRSLRAPRS